MKVIWRASDMRPIHWPENDQFERGGFPVFCEWRRMAQKIAMTKMKEVGRWCIKVHELQRSYGFWKKKAGVRRKLTDPHSLALRHCKNEIRFTLWILSFISLGFIKLKFDKMKFEYWSNNFPPKTPCIVPLDHLHSPGCCGLHLTQLKKWMLL